MLEIIHPGPVCCGCCGRTGILIRYRLAGQTAWACWRHRKLVRAVLEQEAQ